MPHGIARHLTDPEIEARIAQIRAYQHPGGTFARWTDDELRQSLRERAGGRPPSFLDQHVRQAGDSVPWLHDAPVAAQANAQASLDAIHAGVATTAEDWRVLALVNACPHRGCRISCASAACSAGKGDRCGGREATWSRCRKCVRDSSAGGDP